MSLLRKTLLVCAFALLGIFASHGRAQAACGTMPYTFVNGPVGVGSVVDANTTNANNSFLLGCATTVDNTQIGPAGIFASQIICSTVAQCTFGASAGGGYVFNSTVTFNATHAIQANGRVNISISSGFAILAAGPISAAMFAGEPETAVALIYEGSSGTYGQTAHIVQDICSASGTVGSCTYTFSGTDAPFTSTASYNCAFASVTSSVMGIPTNVSGTSVTFNFKNIAGGTSATVTNPSFNFSCTGS